MSAEDNITRQATSALKHDVKNQLSNISLALEQLRFEVPNQTDDVKYYIDTIYSSCKKINTLLDDL